MGILPIKWVVKYDHGGSSVHAWFDIKAVLDIRTIRIVMIVLRACVHRIGHYGGLDIASPQSDNIGEQPLPSPHFGSLCRKL